jgi:hypothetical protein
MFADIERPDRCAAPHEMERRQLHLCFGEGQEALGS